MSTKRGKIGAQILIDNKAKRRNYRRKTNLLLHLNFPNCGKIEMDYAHIVCRPTSYVFNQHEYHFYLYTTLFVSVDAR